MLPFSFCRFRLKPLDNVLGGIRGNPTSNTSFQFYCRQSGIYTLDKFKNYFGKTINGHTGNSFT
ncbi:hypothetical protein, partial [Treponema sp. R80B11-R83G3]